MEKQKPQSDKKETIVSRLWRLTHTSNSYGVYFACHGNGPHPIKIKKGAYIGMRSSIISQKEEGVVIGENVTVWASSLVNKSIPANSIAVGVPARVIKTKESNQN